MLRRIRNPFATLFKPAASGGGSSPSLPTRLDFNDQSNATQSGATAFRAANFAASLGYGYVPVQGTGAVPVVELNRGNAAGTTAVNFFCDGHYSGVGTGEQHAFKIACSPGASVQFRSYHHDPGGFCDGTYSIYDASSGSNVLLGTVVVTGAPDTFTGTLTDSGNNGYVIVKFKSSGSYLMVNGIDFGEVGSIALVSAWN